MCNTWERSSLLENEQNNSIFQIGDHLNLNPENKAQLQI
jgi:hypothetical protein